MPKKKKEGAADVAASSPVIAGEVADLHDDMEQANQRQYKGIAILGSHPATVAKAPLQDPDWLIYACSPHNIEKRTLPRVNEWFEIHLPVTHPTRNYEYLRRLEENKVAANPPHCEVIWARDPEFLSRCRDARPYPEKQLKQMFNRFAFTSSIAFMMAKAIVDCKQMKIPALGLWGIMQASPSEYTYQRPGIQYFAWEADRLGLNIMAPEESRLFDEPPEDF